MKVVKIPSVLNIENTLQFFNRFLIETMFEPTIEIDFSNLRHVEPFSMILLASGLWQLYPTFGQVLLSHKGMASYPAFMGLYHHCGFQNSGYSADYKKGNPRYLKIKKVFCDEILAKAFLSGSHFCDELQEMSDELAFVLARDKNSDLYFTLSYAIREMLRNVMEHSQSDHFLYCAQYWPTQDKIEIGIIDSGMGLKDSLNRNPKYTVKDDKEAIIYALTPGVTSSNYGSGGPKGEWFNSGYGLYLTSRICEEGGSFLILSGSECINKTNRMTTTSTSAYKGTGVRLILKPSMIKNLGTKLEQYKQEADTIVRISGGIPTGQSPSTMLKVAKQKFTT